MNRPVIIAVIASPGHSGQTWLSLLIGSHPAAVSLGEIDALYGLQDVSRSCMLCGGGCEFWSSFNKVWKPEDNIFLQLADFSGARLLSLSKVEKFRSQLFNARIKLKVIRLLRDGRAVTASYARKYPERRYGDIVKAWANSAQENDRWVLNLPPDDRIVVSYENLLDHTSATMRYICSFLGIDYSDALIEYWKVKHHIVDGNRGTLSFVQRYFGKESNPKEKAFYNSQNPSLFRDERWRQELTPYQLYQFQKIGGNLNGQYGYDKIDGLASLADVAGAYLQGTYRRTKKQPV
jgi:hypothetical protein